MAFDPTAFNFYIGPVGGEGVRQYSYRTATDNVTTVVGSGYFADCVRFGVREGDLVWVTDQTSAPANTYLAYVSHINSDGDVTVSVATLEAEDDLPGFPIYFISRVGADKRSDIIGGGLAY